VKEFSFRECLDFVLDHEGGYSNNKADSGGETKYGISDKRDGKIDGKADLNSDGFGDVSIRYLSPEEAGVIYKRDYWEASNCELIHGALRLWLFDTAVNCGVYRAVKMLQNAAGAFADGRMGSVTARLVNVRNQKMLFDKCCIIREEYYRGIVMGKLSQKVFLTGWLNRVGDIREAWES